MTLKLRNSLNLRPKNSATNTASNIASEAQSAQQHTSSAGKYTHGASSAPHDNQYSALRTYEDHQYGNVEYQNIDDSPTAASKHQRGFSTSSEDNMILSSPTGRQNSHSPTSGDYILSSSEAYPSTATSRNTNRMSGMGGGQGFAKKTLRGKQLVASSRTGAASGYHHNIDLSNAFETPLPFDQNPSQPLADRFESYHEILANLINYLKEIRNQLGTRAKGNKKLIGLVEKFEFPDTFLRQNGLAGGLETFSRGDKASSDEAEKDIGHLDDIMSALENLRHELSGKVEEIRHLDSDFQSAIMTELDNTKRSVGKLNDSLEKLEGDSTLAVKEDPYLLRHATDRQIEKQIQEEHYLHTAHSQLEETGLELERLVVYEIQKTYRAVAGFHERLSAVYLKTARSIYDSVDKMPTDTEWNHWIQKAGGSDIFLHNVPIRHLSDINYPGRDHPRCVKIREGQLERRGKYLKGFSPGYYVLTKTHLHEFKSRDSVTPVMSLYLPDQSLGSHSANGGENNKFTLKGKQAGGIHAANHNWTFRVQTYNEMLAWYNDIKQVIEPSSHHTGALAAGVGVGAAGGTAAGVLGSHRHERVSSDSSDANEFNAVDGQSWTGIVGDNSAHSAARAQADQPTSQQQTRDIPTQLQATNLERSAQYQPALAQSYPTTAQTAQAAQTDSAPIQTSAWNLSEKLPDTSIARKPVHETVRESTQAHDLVYPAVAAAMGAGGASYATHQYQDQDQGQGQTQPHQDKAQLQYAQSQPSASAQQWTRNQPSATSTDSRSGPYHPSLAFDSSDHQGTRLCGPSIVEATTAVAGGAGLGAGAGAAAHDHHKIQQAQELNAEQRKDLEAKGFGTSTERETATENTAHQLASNDAAYSTEQWDNGAPRDTTTQQPGLNIPVTSDRASNWSTDEIRHSHGRSGPGSMLEPSDHSTGPSNISGVGAAAGAAAAVGTGAAGLPKEAQKSPSAANSLDSYNTIGLDGGVWNPLSLGSKAQRPLISAGSEVSQNYKDEHPSVAYGNLESVHGNVPVGTNDKTETSSGFGATSDRPGITSDAGLPMTTAGGASGNTASRDAASQGAFGTTCHPGSTVDAGLPTATSESAFGTTSGHLGTTADAGLPTTAAGQSTKSRDVTTLCHSNLPGSFPSTEETPESRAHTDYGTAPADALGGVGAAGGLTSTAHKYNQASKARKAEEELKEHQYRQAPGSTLSPVASSLATEATTSRATGVPIGGTNVATESSRSGFTDPSKHDYAAKPSTASSATSGTDKYANQELPKIPTEQTTKHSEGEGGSSIPGTGILGSMIGAVGLGDAAAALTGNNDKEYQHADQVKSAGKTREGDSSEHHYSRSSEALSDARDSDKSASLGDKIRGESDNSVLAHPDASADGGAPSLRGKSSILPPSNIGGPNPEGGPQFQHSARGMLDVNPKEDHVLGEERPKAWSMIAAAEKELRSKGELPSDQSSVGPTNTTEKRRRSASFVSRKCPDGSQHHQVTAAPGQLIPTQSHKATQSQASTVPDGQAKTPGTGDVNSSQSQAFQPSYESHGSSGGKPGGIGATAAIVSLSNHGDQVKKQTSTKQSSRAIQASDFAHDPTTNTYGQGQPVAQDFAIQGYPEDDASRDMRDPAGSRNINAPSASKPSGISAGPAGVPGAADTTGTTSTYGPTKPAGPASTTSTTGTSAAVQDASKHHHRRGSSLESFGAAAPAPIIDRMKDDLYMPHPKGPPVLPIQQSEAKLQKETDRGIASENQIIDVGQRHETTKRTSGFAEDEFTRPAADDSRTLDDAKNAQSLSSKIGDKIVAAAGVAGVGGTAAMAMDHVLSRKEKKKKKAKNAECKAMRQSSDEDLGQSYASTGPESSSLTAPQSTTEAGPAATIPAAAVGGADADAVIHTPTISGAPQAYEDTSGAPATIDASQTYDTPHTDVTQSYDTSRASAVTGAPRTYENTTKAPQAYRDNSCTTPVTAGCAGECNDTSLCVPTSRNAGVPITEKSYDSTTSTVPETMLATSTTTGTTTGATYSPGIYVTPSSAHRLDATDSANQDYYSIPKEDEHEGSSGVGLSATIADALGAGAAALGLTASHEERGTHKDD